MYLKRIRCEVMDWIILAQDTVKWWAVIDNVMNLLVFHRRLGIF
jgi:hypothetical protein